jgi:hypothetical protein
MGFKNPPNAFYSKGTVMSAKCNTQKKSFWGLKSSEGHFVFNGKDPSIEQSNGRWVIAVNRVAPSIAQKFSRK